MLHLLLLLLYFHYDYDLTYKRFGASASMALNKNPRSQIPRSFVLSYNHFNRDLSEVMQQKNDYSRYNIWNIGFVYSENNVILEKYLFWEFADNGQLPKTNCRKFLSLGICQR